MKAFITILSVLVCSLCVAQGRITPAIRYDDYAGIPQAEIVHTPGTFVMPDKVPYTLQEIDSTEYDYFAAYLVIQTSEVTQEQLDYTKKLMKYVKQNHGILYITIQSGTPPCVPSPGHPCPKK